MYAFHCQCLLYASQVPSVTPFLPLPGKRIQESLCESLVITYSIVHILKKTMCPWLQGVLCSLVVTPVSAKFLQSSTHGELLAIFSLYLAFRYTLYACKSDVRLLTFTEGTSYSSRHGAPVRARGGG